MGFRPAVHNIARRTGLTGFVYNDTRGVTIELQGEQEKIDEFLLRLQTMDKPPMALIKTCEAIEIPLAENAGGFIIEASNSQGSPISQVTADMAICADCLSEMRDKKDFRFRYPFINCTNCGPRYSIIKNIPYDRPNTTMSIFKMCEKCHTQYTDVTDRRFHAQPVACPACGPKIWLTDSSGKTIETHSDKVIAQTATLLHEGKIAAIKGIGGFHLAVDALNNEAVARLRERKRRDHKPFAMMTDSIEKITKYVDVSKAAELILKSPLLRLFCCPKKKTAKSPPPSHKTSILSALCSAMPPCITSCSQKVLRFS